MSHNWLKLKDIGTNAKTDAPSMSDRLPTLTLLPPDAHILIPLLIKVRIYERNILLDHRVSSLLMTLFL